MRRFRDTRGFALYVLLACTLLLSMLALSAYFYAMRTVRFQRDQLFSELGKEAANEANVESFEVSAGDTDSCVEGGVSAGGAAFRRRLCGLIQRGETPQFDYNAIFSGAVSCSGPLESYERTPKGFELSPSALLSKHICDNEAIDWTRSSSFFGNLSTAETLTPPPSAEPRTIAATGFMDLGSGITATSDLLIAAGGDLHLKLLQIPSGSPSITLISATGVLMIDEIQGSPRLNIAGRLGVFMPSPQNYAAGRLLAPLLSRHAAGFTESTGP